MRIHFGMPNHWEHDEFTQESPDYSGEANVDRARKRSGKPSAAAKAAQMVRWRALHRSHSREYQRLWKQAARAALRAERLGDAS